MTPSDSGSNVVSYLRERRPPIGNMDMAVSASLPSASCYRVFLLIPSDAKVAVTNSYFLLLQSGSSRDSPSPRDVSPLDEYSNLVTCF